MQVLFYFLLTTIEILLMSFGMLRANEQDGWIFKKVLTVPSLSSVEIISAHGVQSEIECSFNCVKEKECVGFKYKPVTKNESVNCKLSKSADGKDRVVNYDDQDWQFFINVNYNIFYVFVESRGCDDPQGSEAIIKVNGKDYALSNRGFNIVVVDHKTGYVESSTSYDTYASFTETRRMVEFLNAVSSKMKYVNFARLCEKANLIIPLLMRFFSQKSKIVLVAIADEGSVGMTNEGYQALSQVAAEDITSLDFRDSFALIGYTGKEKPSFVKQVHNVKGKGPSVVHGIIDKKS